jgi:hypothetical protein
MRNNLARVLIGIVFLWNLQCAVVFLLLSERYAPQFQLSGAIGEAMIQGMGILFLMWNVPYAVALWNPIRHRLSLYEAITMQAIGFIGETIIWLGLPPGYSLASNSLVRFMIFDVAGLLLLVVAAWINRTARSG